MVEKINPPITAIPIGADWLPASPKPIAMGSVPAIMATLVISIGRSLPSAASRCALLLLPALRNCSALVMNKTALAIDTPIAVMMPIYDWIFRLCPVNKSRNSEPAITAGIVAPVELTRTRNQLMADSSSYEAARLLARSYEQVAGLLVLRAPFAGTVTARSVDRGALVGTSQPLLTLQDNRSLRLRIAVPELYLASQTATKEVKFRVDAFPEKIYSATLSRKSGAIDPSTRTEQWEYRFDNRSNELIAGSFAYVKLSLQRTGNSFVVAPGTIVTNQERKFVIRIKEGKAEWVDVRQGMSTDKGTEIFGNLQNGDSLVVRATDERKPGTVAYWKRVE